MLKMRVPCMRVFSTLHCVTWSDCKCPTQPLNTCTNSVRDVSYVEIHVFKTTQVAADAVAGFISGSGFHYNIYVCWRSEIQRQHHYTVNIAKDNCMKVQTNFKIDCRSVQNIWRFLAFAVTFSTPPTLSGQKVDHTRNDCGTFSDCRWCLLTPST